VRSILLVCDVHDDDDDEESLSPSLSLPSLLLSSSRECFTAADAAADGGDGVIAPPAFILCTSAEAGTGVVPHIAAEEYKDGGTALLLAAFLRGVRWWTWCWCSAWVDDMVQ
jgi:hypothetical protein